MKIKRDFESCDRYKFDYTRCTVKKGFAQIDTSQDAHYYGTWANPFDLKIITYCEGDVTTQEAESVEEFVGAIHDLKRWNDDRGHRFIGIDPGFDEKLKARFEEIELGCYLH